MTMPKQLKQKAIPVPVGLSEYMAAIGSKGGKIGGKRRMTTLTPERRKEIAQQAAAKRWKNKPVTL